MITRTGEFNVGDVVKIEFIKGNSCLFGINSTMKSLTGKIVRIDDITPYDEQRAKVCLRSKNPGVQKILERYSWSSDMIVRVSNERIKNAWDDIELPDDDKEHIISQMEHIFSYLGYSYKRPALEKIVETWFENKKELIYFVSKHPNYVKGKYYIQFDHDFEREINKNDLKVLFEEWYINSSAAIIKELHSNKNEVYQERLKKEENVFIPDSFKDFLKFLSEYGISTVEDEFLARYDLAFRDYNLGIKIAKGMKTSRAVNRICVALGIDKTSTYNKVFAIYSDALSPLKIRRHTVISCNPIDYLLMSNGNSWTSCHTINKFSKEENNYGGMHAAGTVSYMLDASSLVYYEVSSDYSGDEIEMEPKIIRQMYHYGDHALVQARMYPQSNDEGSKNLYAEKRNIVQKIFAEILEVPNRWVVKTGISACDKIVYHDPEGKHYHDTSNFENCNVSILRGEEDNEKGIYVGHSPICIECGEDYCSESELNCCHDPVQSVYERNISATPKRGAII